MSFFVRVVSLPLWLLYTGRRAPLFVVSLLVMCLLQSCGVSPMKSEQTVNFTSNPKNCHLTVHDDKGVMVYSGKTPAMVSLRRKRGPYSPANYEIECSKPNWVSKGFTMSPRHEDDDLWVVSTITVLPALLRLATEPATKSQWTYPKQVEISLLPRY